MSGDPSVIAKVLVVIDTCVNCWLTECSITVLRCTVDDQLINLSNLHRSICTRTFTFDLMSSIQKHTPNTNKRNYEQHTDDDTTPSKCIPVQYLKCSPRWRLREGEDYRTVFNNKHSEKLLNLNGVHLCPQWLIKGVYFTGCNLAATHCEICDTAFRHKINLYCKLCCGE